MSGDSRSTSCERTWEIEAARDGRLQPKDLSSLERHVAQCAVCKAEQQLSASLSASLRNLPAVADDLLAARRQRHRLLADANRWMIGQAPAKRRGAATARVGFAFALVALVTAYAFSRQHRAVEVAHVRLPTTSAAATRSVAVDVTAESGTLWHERRTANGLTIELDSGQLAARIGARDPAQVVRIQLPDGWIEDLGTVLSVRVSDRHTQEVRVMEGRVRLRLAGREPLELAAGEAWTAAPNAPIQPPVVVPATSASRAHHVAAAASAVGDSAAGVRPDRGDTSAADGERATRDEDEAYLHIVALVRAHRTAEARDAAKDYLLRFPSGFRREEVLGVATR